MKKVAMTGLLLLGLAGLTLFASQAVGKAMPPEVAPSVELARYMGKWYEIARMPMFFQRNCTGNTTAEYTLLPDGRVKVFNSCDKASGERIEAEGRAKVADPKTNARLKVTFAHFLGRWWELFSGDYWVIQLADDYRYAVVGHPERKYGWILSRTPAVLPEDLLLISERLQQQGYDTCAFKTTIQKNGFATEKPLCNVVETSENAQND